jgi:molybdate transport system substrate-binding protein
VTARLLPDLAPVLALAILAAAACAPATEASPSATRATLTVYAAASLKRALDAVKPGYARTDPGTELAVSTDSSTALATKIEQGAPVDVFLSADTANPARLAAEGLADAPIPFAANTPVVVVPRGDATVSTPADLAKRGVKIVAAADGVPITAYARQLIARLASARGIPAGFVAGYEANVVSREDNVGAVLAKVALGEADAGIVYATDARSSPAVTVIPIPPGVDVRATYAGTVIRSSPNGARAAAFLGWLAGSGGRAVLEPLGFLPPP